MKFPGMKSLRSFRNEETGAVSVEAVLVFPILLWAFAAMFVFWDAFKAQNINLKASYTVADLISREDQPIDQAYINGMNDVYQFLIKRDDGNDLQVTVVSVGLGPDGETPELRLEWSHATGSMPVVTEIDQIEDALPMLSVGDQIIVVQTEMEWVPLIKRIPVMGLIMDDTTMDELVFTAPRFTPQVCWEVCD